jgi:Arabinose-binding domain of AraC transcription regulator, N-term
MNKFRLPETFLAKLKTASINPAFLLRKSGLPPVLCSCSDGMISPEQFFRLWLTLGEVSEDPVIGLRMATLNPPCHVANIAARQARTFGDALPHLARCAALCFSEHMRIVKTKNECSIEFTGALLNEAAPLPFLDTTFALVHETGRRGTQQPLHPVRGAYLNRYVTEEQCSRRPICIATLWAARLLAGCFVAHRSKTTAGISLFASRIQPKYAAAPLHQSLTWRTRVTDQVGLSLSSPMKSRTEGCICPFMYNVSRSGRFFLYFL